jgi:hypothetical protein
MNCPYYVDGRRFETTAQAFQYLQEIDGRIHFDRFERALRQGRRILDGHVLGKPEAGRDVALSLYGGWSMFLHI